MPRWDDEEVVFSPVTHDNAPCHSCAYCGGRSAANAYCEKYLPSWNIGIDGKPREILEGLRPCKFYKKI